MSIRPGAGATQDRQRSVLEGLGKTNVLKHLDKAGADPGSLLHGIAHAEILRGFAEEWIAEKDREEAIQVARTLWWAQAATWVSIVGIVLAVIGLWK